MADNPFHPIVFRPIGLLAILATLGMLACPAPAVAQRESGARSVPAPSYYLALAELHNGDIGRALDGFRDESRGAIKTSQSRWLDSICYHAMIGECYFTMGQYAEALENYDAALRLYLSFSDWMIRTKFPPRLSADASRARLQIPWQKPARKFRLGLVPRTVSISQGSLTIRQGGIFQQAVLFPIDGTEIVRCTVLSLRRRRQILGPLAKHDPLTGRLIAILARRPTKPNHWVESWIDLKLGLAYAAGDQMARAQQHLKRAIVAAGEFDHPLTCVALVELARLALESDNLPDVMRYTIAASHAAVYYENPTVLEEAFVLGTQAHIMSNGQGTFAPLSGAARWARGRRVRKLRVRLVALQAENLAYLRQPAPALTALGEAKGLIGRRDLGRGTLGARLAYLTALIASQKQPPQAVSEPLARALDFQRRGSLALFRIGRANALYQSQTVTARVAVAMYQNLLGDPQAADWSADPLEALSRLTIPHLQAYNLWFQAALERKEIHTAIKVADLARRHRFLSSLPLGGRTLSLRWILGAPVAGLPEAAAIARQDILARYPELDQLGRQVRSAQAALAKLPITPADHPTFDQQTALCQQIALASESQEKLLTSLALSRQGTELVFPPVFEQQRWESRLPADTAVWSFYHDGAKMHAFLAADGQYAHWTIGSTKVLRKGIIQLLRELGNYDANRELSLADITSNQWRSTAAKLVKYLLQGSKVDLAEGITELVIVPDGELWYVPFAALPISTAHDQPLLINHLRLRYAPLVSLATSGDKQPRATQATGVVTGRLFPRDSDGPALLALEDLRAAVPDAVGLTSPLPGPATVYRTRLRRLVVYDDLTVAADQPYAWRPLVVEHSKRSETLADWFTLPWGNPSQVVLPGFHTLAEHAMKQKPATRPGDDLFLGICGLMAGGTRTVLISRWRTGGQSAFDLSREFVQELPHLEPADAWQRSVQLGLERTVDWEREPRIKRFDAETPPHATHPFFWAGYLLIDSGPSSGPAPPAVTAPPAAGQVQ